MNKYSFASFVSAILLFPVFLFAQKIDSMMKIYADNYPQEKVYVHFDKNVYNPGETIWFMTYLFAGSDPSSASKNFYTELADADGNILLRKVALLFESAAAGSFEIPQDIKYNHLHFRAYTTWMLNFDTAFIYEKDIRIMNTVRDSPVVAASQERYLRFFPEGGEVVAGLENNISFTATDQYGL